MANKSLFAGHRGRTVPKTDAVNAAGGKAYQLSNKGALARYAATGCLSNTFYVKAEDQLNTVRELALKCDSEFLGKLAIFSRKEGYMKDMPALLLSIVACRSDEKSRRVLRAAFPVAIDNGRMVRNFVQIMRSGTLGRKSLGTGPRNLVRGFFARNKPNWLFRQLSVGQDPSGADIIKMVHPSPATPEHEALFGYMVGKLPSDKRTKKWKSLPPLVKEFEAWKKDHSNPIPRLDFRLFTADKLSGAEWAQLFRNGQYHFIRMNLNTAIRQGALKADPGLEQFIADSLRNKEVISKVRLMPYQLMAAYAHVDPSIPRSIVNALHDAMEAAVDNVPIVNGKTVVVVDVSGSMHSSVTGNAYGMRGTASKVSCVAVASLFSAAILRKNEDAIVLPVDTRIHGDYRPEPRNTIITESQKLAKFGGGGTNLGLAFQYISQKRMKVDNVIIISDQESWADRSYGSYGYSFSGLSGRDGTVMMQEWEKIRSRNRLAKLVCIDIQPGRTHQAIEGREEILHVAGWSDAVFKVTDAFLRGDVGSWLEIIENIPLEMN